VLTLRLVSSTATILVAIGLGYLTESLALHIVQAATVGIRDDKEVWSRGCVELEDND
jgi:hypothetical protein